MKDARANSLAHIAGALAAINPDDAERVAQSITDESSKAFALVRLAIALAATDPDRAERIGLSITNEISQIWVLTAIAKASGRVVAHHSADSPGRTVIG